MTLNWCYRCCMAKQDAWTRITLRLPPELHEKLVAAAEANSLNAEIVARLERTFTHEMIGPANMTSLGEADVRQLVSDILREVATQLPPDTTVRDLAATVPPADFPMPGEDDDRSP